MSVAGVARDLAAAMDVPFSFPEYSVERSGESVESVASVEVHDADGCLMLRPGIFQPSRIASYARASKLVTDSEGVLRASFRVSSRAETIVLFHEGREVLRRRVVLATTHRNRIEL